MLQKEYCFKTTHRNSHLFKVKSTNKCYYSKILLQDCNPIPPNKMILVTFQAKMLHAFRSCHFILPCFWHNMLPRQTHYAFAMPPCFFPCSWHIMLLRQEYGVLQLISYVLGKKGKLLFTITIHLSLFTVTIHCYCSLRNFCLFKGGYPLYLSKCFLCLVQDFFLRESFPLRAFLCENILTYYNFLLSLQSL